MKETRYIVCALAAALSLGTLTHAQASDFPAQPVRMVIGYAAGGPTDITARALAQDLAPLLGQSVVVENRPGASASIAADYVAKSSPDGYTVLVTSLTHTINPLMLPSANYDPVTDYTPVALLTGGPGILVVGESQPYKSVKELVDAAKAKPGTISYGSSGNGGSAHLTGALLASQAGVEMLHVPYKGNGPALNDVMAGHIAFMFSPLNGLNELISSGRLRALGITSSERNPMFPDVPTMKEAGFNGFGDEVAPWIGILAPPGTPADRVQHLSDAALKVLADPDSATRKHLASNGSLANPKGPEDFKAFLVQDTERWKRVLDAAGIERK
nr:tripartite tricarboxylate transporter substrate binding protein [Pseudomonas sp.]